VPGAVVAGETETKEEEEKIAMTTGSGTEDMVGETAAPAIATSASFPYCSVPQLTNMIARMTEGGVPHTSTPRTARSGDARRSGRQPVLPSRSTRSP
jgi:hypothetical protein